MPVRNLKIPTLDEETGPWDDDFFAEPSDDVFVQTLTTGIADGTLAQSDSEFGESDDDGKQYRNISIVLDLRVM